MKKLLTFAAFSTAILCSCGQQASQQAETAAPAESTVEATAGINELTAQEKAEGWQLLFDGKTTKGWRGAHKETFPDKGWEIKDGVLTVLPADGGESTNGGDIVTEGVYSAFELSVDFQITPGANSGIKYFVTEQEKQMQRMRISLKWGLVVLILLSTVLVGYVVYQLWDILN